MQLLTDITICLFQGSVSRCEVAGQVNVKSFLVGCPDIKIGLNEDLMIGKSDTGKGESGCVPTSANQMGWPNE